MITPSYRLINPPTNKSFVLKWEPFDLTTRWHYHPEVELIYFIKGNTSAVIGDVFKEFKEGDLVLLGANFPHVLQESKDFIKHSEIKPFGLIIQFTENFLGEDFITKPELSSIRDLLQKAHRGLQFQPSIIEKVKNKLNRMPKQNDSQKLLILLDILFTLAEGECYEYMTHHEYSYDYSHDEERMKRIHQFVYKHFMDKISIADVASVANMTEASFCRYFKSRTLKTFSHFLNEIRIAYACKMLQEKNNSVTDVCFASGYGSLPYFSRKFKSMTNMSPQQYQGWKQEVIRNK